MGEGEGEGLEREREREGEVYFTQREHHHLPPHEVGEFHIDVGEWILGGRMA